MIKKLHPEVLENRALLANVACTTGAETVTWSCTTSGDFTVLSTIQYVSVQCDGDGSVTASSTEFGKVNIEAKECRLIATNTDNPFATGAVTTTEICTLVDGKTGDHSTKAIATCNFPAGSGLSGQKTLSAPSFINPVTFNMITPLGIDYNGKVLKKGEFLLSGPMTITFSADSDSAPSERMSTFSVNFNAILTGPTGSDPFTAPFVMISEEKGSSNTEVANSKNLNPDVYTPEVRKQIVKQLLQENGWRLAN